MSIFRAGYFPKTLSDVLPYIYYTMVSGGLQPHIFHSLWCWASMMIFRQSIRAASQEAARFLFANVVLFWYNWAKNLNLTEVPDANKTCDRSAL